MTYLHQVSYLRLFARWTWCVPIILLSIRYNMCACRSPIYCCLSGTTCILTCHGPKSKISLQYCYYCVLGILYHSCVRMCRGSVKALDRWATCERSTNRLPKLLRSSFIISGDPGRVIHQILDMRKWGNRFLSSTSRGPAKQLPER